MARSEEHIYSPLLKEFPFIQNTSIMKADRRSNKKYMSLHSHASFLVSADPPNSRWRWQTSYRKLDENEHMHVYKAFDWVFWLYLKYIARKPIDIHLVGIWEDMHLKEQPAVIEEGLTCVLQRHQLSSLFPEPNPSITFECQSSICSHTITFKFSLIKTEDKTTPYNNTRHY